MANQELAKTKVAVIQQGQITISPNGGYMLVAGGDCACFYIDPSERTYCTLWSASDSGCPVVALYPDNEDEGTVGTIIEFIDFPGWHVHAMNGGKTIAVALVKDSWG